MNVVRPMVLLVFLMGCGTDEGQSNLPPEDAVVVDARSDVSEDSMSLSDDAVTDSEVDNSVDAIETNDGHMPDTASEDVGADSVDAPDVSDTAILDVGLDAIEAPDVTLPEDVPDTAILDVWVDESDTSDVALPEDVPDTAIVDVGLDTANDLDVTALDDVTDSVDTTPEMDTDGGVSCGPCVPSKASMQQAMDSGLFVKDLERTKDNPLKGFMTSYLWGKPANDFPDQMEFFYLPIKELWGPNGATFETGLEPHLEAALARGHHVVLRVYVDYPKKPPGLPAYLKDQVSCKPYTEHGGGCSPDYDNPALVEAMVGLMTALGAKYDGDPRLGVLQVGLLGFWGEWHTYPYPEWFASNATQKAVLQAAHDAFKTTQLQVRRPAANSVSLRIGFHDDSFAYSTLGETGWFFLPSLISAGAAERWKEVMIGGELRPELQGVCFQDNYTLGTNAQDVVDCIDGTHASYLLNYKAFNEDGKGYQGAERDKAEKAALHMGYQFELNSADITLSGLNNKMVDAKITVTLSQTGVAPFYYALSASLYAQGAGILASSTEDLKTLQPGQNRTLSFELGSVPVSVVNSPIELRLASPMLLPTQRIALATTTAKTLPDGDTVLSFAVTCESEGKVASLGEALGDLSKECPCICDVDGLFRTCDGTPCP